MPLDASVIVPTFDDWRPLQTCLDGLARQSIGLERIEVIIANNNASPEVPGDLRLPDNARIIHATTPGSYAARNAALLEARSEVLFFTDSDCQPDSRWIETGLAAIRRLGPHGRVAGGVELFPRGAIWTAPELYDRVHLLRQADYVDLGWCVTANLVVWKSAFDLVGPFSEDRFSGGDGEWNLRATALGLELAYHPEVLIRHPARPTFADLARKRRRRLGSLHQSEVSGVLPRRGLGSYLTDFMSGAELRRTWEFPGLTPHQRFEVFRVGMRLGVVSLAEMVRLRHFSGKPSRN